MEHQVIVGFRPDGADRAIVIKLSGKLGVGNFVSG